MGFYSEIAKDINYEIAMSTEKYLKVVGGKLQLPNPKWLAYHLNFLDKIIETIHLFRNGELVEEQFNLETIESNIIDNAEEGIQFLNYLAKNYTTFAVDIESDNLSTDKEQNEILCIGLAYENCKAVSFMKNCFISPIFSALFQEFCLNSNFTFILHNGVFDRSRARIIADITLKIDEDTLLKHYIGINEHKGTHGLKDLAELYLGFPNWEADLDAWKRQYCKKNKIKLMDFKYSYFNQKMLAEYNTIDCCATFQLNTKLDKLMRPSSWYIYRKVVEAAPIYADMIVRGMKLDVEYWEQLKIILEKEKETLEHQFTLEAPNVSISSPIQLRKWLTTRFPLETIESTNASSLKLLARTYPEDTSLKTIMEHRKNSKYLKTYVYGLWKRKDFDDVIHCEFKLHGTETGRLSSSNPNMQNIPRSPLIKSLFIAREGRILGQFDYSQLELRVLAHISGDKTLIDCYKNGRDLHWEMQQKIFKQEANSEDKEQRMAAKIVNFGIPYGRTAGGVSKQLNVSMSTAKRYLEDWHEGAPEVHKYIDKCHEMALKEPQDVWYTVFGRCRQYFITSENVYHTRNQSVNFPITSTANDITIHALIEIDKWLKEQKIDAYIVNSVHDSIIIEMWPEDAQRIAEACCRIMAEIPPKYLVGTEVPFKADVEFGECWGKLTNANEYFDEEEEDTDDNSIN